MSNNANSFALLLLRANGSSERIKPRGVSCDVLCAQLFEQREYTQVLADEGFPFVLFYPELYQGHHVSNVIGAFMNKLIQTLYPERQATSDTDDLHTTSLLLIGRNLDPTATLDLMYVMPPDELVRLERLFKQVQRDQERKESMAKLERIYKKQVHVTFEPDSLDAPLGTFAELELAAGPASSGSNEGAYDMGALLDDDDSEYAVEHSHTMSFEEVDDELPSEDLSEKCVVSDEGGDGEPPAVIVHKRKQKNVFTGAATTALGRCEHTRRNGTRCPNVGVHRSRKIFCEAHRCVSTGCERMMQQEQTLCFTCMYGRNKKPTQEHTDALLSPVTMIPHGKQCVYKANNGVHCSNTALYMGKVPFCEAHRCKTCERCKVANGSNTNECLSCSNRRRAHQREEEEKQEEAVRQSKTGSSRKLRSQRTEEADDEADQPAKKRRRVEIS